MGFWGIIGLLYLSFVAIAGFVTFVGPIIVKHWRSSLVFLFFFALIFALLCGYEGFLSNKTLWITYIVVTVLAFASFHFYQDTKEKEENFFSVKNPFIWVSSFTLVACLVFGATLYYHHIKTQVHHYLYNEMLCKYYDECNEFIKKDRIPLLVNGSARVKQRNRVGDDWSFYYRINNSDRIATSYTLNKENESILYNYGDTIRILSEAIEHDKISDYGNTKMEIQLTRKQALEGCSFENLVYVYENRGRYAGYRATIQFTYSIKADRPKRIEYDEIEVPRDSIMKYLWKPIEVKGVATKYDPIASYLKSCK